jgi:Kef-type K+ transport system membrane component KefB
MAVVVETKELLETVIASVVAGVGITVVFSVAIWGVARFADLSRNERPIAAGAAATLAALAGLVTLAAVAFGLVFMSGQEEAAAGGAVRDYTFSVRALRDIAIIMALALAVAFAPHGGNVAEAILTAITMGFLAALAWMVFVLGRQNQLTLATLTDARWGFLYAALGMLALLVAGSDELFSTGGGTLVWIALLGASVAAIWRIWIDANSY